MAYQFALSISPVCISGRLLGMIGGLFKAWAAIYMYMTKQTPTVEELGLFIGRYVAELCDNNPAQVLFVTPCNIVEMFLECYEFESIQDFSLKGLLDVAREHIPAYLREKQVKIIYA